MKTGLGPLLSRRRHARRLDHALPLVLAALLIPAIPVRGAELSTRHDPAVQKAQIALNRKPSDPERHKMLAEACVAVGTVEGRRIADEVYARAVHRFPKNTDLLMSWAELSRSRRFTTQARDLFLRVTAVRPDYAPARLCLAQMALELYRRRMKPNDLREAGVWYDRYLAAVPTDAEALSGATFVRLALGDSLKAAGYADQLVLAHPGDSRGHFFRLLFAAARGDWEDAEAEGNRALKCLTDPTVREAYDSLEPINWKIEKERQDLSEAARHHLDVDFWKRRDLTPATVENERRTEHIARVFLADQYYGIPESGWHGWETPPGEAIIRYGMPVERHVGIGEGMQILNSFQPDRLYQTHAILGDLFTFTFDDQFLTGRWFEPNEDFGYPSDMDCYASLLDSDMGHPWGGPKIPTGIDAVAFRDPDGRTRVEILMSSPDAPDSGSAWGRSVALYDSNWDLLAHREGTFAGGAWVVDRRRPDQKGIVDIVPISLDPGIDSVFIGSQIQSVARHHGFGGQFDLMRVPIYPADSLMVSDIMFLDRIEERGEPDEFTRRDGRGIPNPDAVYYTGEEIPIYFEAYGLTPGEEGLSHYELQIEVNDLDAASNWTGPRRAEVVERKKKNRPRSSSLFEESGTGDRIERLLSLSLGALPKGDYRLNLRVTDLRAGRHALAQADFRVVKRPKVEAAADPQVSPSP